MAANQLQQRQQQHWQLWHQLLHGDGSVGAAAAGCTLTVGAAGRGLVGAGGVLRFCPRGLRYALAAWALPLWLGLCPCRLGFAFAAGATRLLLGLCPRILTLPALPSWLALCAHDLSCGGGGGGSGSDGGGSSPLRLMLRTPGLGFALAAQLCPIRARGSHYALAARLCPHTTIKSKSAAAKAASAALPLICRSGSG